MHANALRTIAASAAILLVAACAEPVAEPAGVETPAGSAAATAADAPSALPEVVYYKISDS